MRLSLLLVLPACSLFAPDPPPTPTRPADEILADLRGQRLVFTRMGECRMACAHLGRDEVTALIATAGLVPPPFASSGECQAHALEGAVDGRRIRLTVADCPGETRVITVTDPADDTACACD